MKHFLLNIIAILGVVTGLYAKNDGYKISIEIKGLENQNVQLAHYYGRPMTVYKVDSLKLDSKGKGTLSHDSVIVGGLYLIMNPLNGQFVEFILNNGDKLKLSTDTFNLRNNATVSGSEDNKYFYDYQNFLEIFEKEHNKINVRFTTAKNEKDSNLVKSDLSAHLKILTEYREKFYKDHPEAFLSKIFGAMYEPIVPTEKHYLPSGVEDTLYVYHYMKDHYWDRFPFDDERIAYTPVYNDKINNYFERLVYKDPDSISKESLWLCDTTRNSTELFKYTLWFVNRYIWSSKIMGMDAAIIPISEKYFGDKKNVFWLNDEEYEKVMKKIMLIKPNVIGNLGQNLNLEDRQGKSVSLYNIPADYLVMVFWAPDCGHCRKEMPKLDSFYHANLEGNYKMQMIAIKTEGDSNQYNTFIKDNNLEKGWLHLNDDKRLSNFRYYYDVETTPMIYILNKKRQIIGKHLKYEDIGHVIDFDKNKN